jgi:hypothetical protein
MTRFKELARIERAIANSDSVDLRWAEAYARSRIQTARNKVHRKYWASLLRTIEAAISPRAR